MADDLTSYLPMYTDPRLAPGGASLYTTRSIPLQNTGGVTGSFGTPLPAATAPAPAAAAPAPAATDAPKFDASTAAVSKPRAAAMPKTAAAPVVPNQPAEPLVPGVTGFQVNDGPVVPFGTRFMVSGDGTAQQLGGAGGAGGGLYDNLPGGGKMVNGRFADPRDALEMGFRLQSQYRDESMRQILALAGNGGELGYRARVAALAQAFGQNNFGGAAVSGSNALNQAIAHITGAGIGAGASMYGSDAALTGHLAGIAEQGRQFDITPKPIGTEVGRDPLTGMGVPLTTYGQLPGAPAYRGLSTTRPQTYQAGKEYTDKAGNRAVYQADGTWKPVK